MNWNIIFNLIMVAAAFLLVITIIIFVSDKKGS